MKKQKYYSKTTNGFYDSSINSELPDDAVEISENKYKELFSALNKGCIVFDDLTYSESKPSIFHNWDDESKSWILNKDKKSQYDNEQNEIKIKSLIDEATLKISILQDAIDLNVAQDGDEERLKALRKYRILLSRVDTNVVEMVLPEKPD